ncbi:hypothetical protein [Sulfitobacter sp. JB4-11]
MKGSEQQQPPVYWQRIPISMPKAPRMPAAPASVSSGKARIRPVTP